MICLLAVGIYMEETEAFALYPIHKSIGIIILAFAIYRIFVRIMEGWPTPVGNSSALQHAAAKLVHWGLIISTVLFPVSGMMMSGAGGKGLEVFGFELLAKNIDAVTGKTTPINESIAGLGHQIHGTLMWVLIALIVLHVAGALKHHFIDKDETITRMFTFKD